MNANKYNRVLIIGQTFNQTSGGGITLTNLFKGWDKNSIAVAAERIINPDTGVCENYYQLGSLEAKRRFPFNLIEKKFKSGSLKILNSYNPPPKNSFKTNNQKHPNLAKLYESLLHFFGFFHYSRNLKTTNELLNWINEFKPDIIYTQLASYELIKFVSNLNDITNVPIAIHIMDDWPSTISKTSIFRKYWRNKIDKEFRALMDKTSIFLSISDAMSNEYKIRYNKDFIPFHNPIEINNWIKQDTKRINTANNFNILYTGRIGTANNQSIIDICRVIYSKLNVMNITLDIYSNDDCTLIDRYLVENRIVKRSFVRHNEMPQLLSSYHLLLLPLDFTKNGIDFAKYSFPTKASEYMISGTPILVYAPKETALCKHAKDNGWAYVVENNNDEQIVNAIENLITNENLRRTLGNNARKFAIENFDANLVRNKFKQTLTCYRL